MRNHRHSSNSEKVQKGVYTNIGAALQRECPVLLHVPTSDVPSLSQAFDRGDMTSEFSNVMGVKRWEKQHQKGAYAVLEPHSWQEFELIVNKMRERHLEDKLSIAYDGHVIGYRGASMQVHADDKNILSDDWGNGTGPYLLHENAHTRIGMARIFNEKGGHLTIKLPFIEKGQDKVAWKDITPKTHTDDHEYTYAGHVAAHEHD